MDMFYVPLTVKTSEKYYIRKIQNGHVIVVVVYL